MFDVSVWFAAKITYLRDSAVTHGSLEACSAWRYDNYLHMQRKNVRICKSPLIKIVKRLPEWERVYIQEPNSFRFECLSKIK